MTEDGRARVVIEGVSPEVDCGRFPVKRTVGERVAVEADVFADGHDVISCVLKHRPEGEAIWAEVPMEPLVNDRWRGEFRAGEAGRHLYTITAWIDRFRTWRRDLARKAEAGQDVAVEFLAGADLAEHAARRAAGEDADRLRAWARALRTEPSLEAALDPDPAAVVARYPDLRFATTYERELAVIVDRERARFSSWYELFPRSCTDSPERHGTFSDVEARLPYVAGMGFDVLYLPPVHPIGRTHRKGRNNSPVSGPGDVGSPWAIGAEEGGHTEIHPELGTIEDFDRLVARAGEHGLEVALDIAYQCSPDHPWVAKHPEWFRMRPDGGVQYAENPPKKYEDIYPLDFESEAWRDLWEELKGVVEFWIGHGVRIFRVDNPHTKSFAFWEWMIGEVKREHPDVIFLAEAFTRPKVMHRLAKLGFTQSYTYFAWRNTKWELTQYLTELTTTGVREFFRPNFWPNTPDILTEHLQTGGRPNFVARLVLAATLAASYGIYGPAFELCESLPAIPGREEYLDSEKYQVRVWDLDRADSLAPLISRVNAIRRENPALQSNEGLWFLEIANDQIVAHAKATKDLSNVVITVVNLDPHHTQSGWLGLPLEELGIDPAQPYQVHDLLTDARYIWHGTHNYVELNPLVLPAHVLRVRRRVATEQDFEYYL